MLTLPPIICLDQSALLSFDKLIKYGRIKDFWKENPIPRNANVFSTFKLAYCEILLHKWGDNDFDKIIKVNGK